MKKVFKVAILADDNILYDSSKTILFVSGFEHETLEQAETEVEAYFRKNDHGNLIVLPVYRRDFYQG